MSAPLRAPFPYFGGKSRAAAAVWSALGDPAVYVEPFAGSLAVLLARPDVPRVETANDADGFICNLWRALAAAPADVADYADWPVSETDLHARHLWLSAQRRDLEARLLADPDWFDAKVAGRWAWGLSCWIGDGWCAADKPGRRLPNIDGNGGKGCAGAGRGDLREWFRLLSARLRTVRVACGDWSRVVSETALRNTAGGWRGVFLDPPYSEGAQQYAAGGTGTGLSAAVREWAIANGDRPALRIVLCGYEGEHAMPSAWRTVSWKAKGGYGNASGNLNRLREVLHLSPHCLDATRQPSLFDAAVSR